MFFYKVYLGLFVFDGKDGVVRAQDGIKAHSQGSVEVFLAFGPRHRR